MSDLHVDMGSQLQIKWPECDVLIIAGDTANDIGGLLKFLNKVSRRTEIPRILVLDGNHEHYSNASQKRTTDETLLRIMDQMPPRCMFLPLCGGLKIENSNKWFIGVNGWYSFDSMGDPIVNRSVWKSTMNDDRFIGFSKILQTPPWELAERDADTVRERIEMVLSRFPDARFIIATHTAPHRTMLSPDPRFITTNPFYVNTHMERVLEEFGKHIDVWVHGHTHHRGEKMISDAYVIANPRGYPRENPGWEPVVLDL